MVFVHSQCLCVPCPFSCKETTACGDSVHAGRFTCADCFPNPDIAHQPLALSQRAWIPNPCSHHAAWGQKQNNTQTGYGCDDPCRLFSHTYAPAGLLQRVMSMTAHDLLGITALVKARLLDYQCCSKSACTLTFVHEDWLVRPRLQHPVRIWLPPGSASSRSPSPCRRHPPEHGTGEELHRCARARRRHQERHEAFRFLQEVTCRR